LFPGIAVVEELRRRQPELEVLFVGTERGIEARVVPEMGERLALIEVRPLKGRSLVRLAQNVLKLPGAASQALGILRRFRPDLVIGVGGYASGPVLAAAAATGVPTAVLEQNARVGLTNRLLSTVVGRAYVTFPETAATFRAARVRTSGNPVRRAFVDAARRAATDPDGFEARARRLLVMGGSQGAQALNRVVPHALAEAGIADRGIAIVHQTGATMRDEVARQYRELGLDAEVVAFIDDMASAYSAAALVIARAGATTVAELCAVGRPAILVPYPYAADDHQGKNAEALERAGAARCIREADLDAVRLGEEVARLLSDEPARRAMAAAARGLGRPDAAAAIVDDLIEWLEPRGLVEGQEDSTRGGGGRDADDPVARRLALRGERAYVPRLGAFTGRRRSALPAHRRPVTVSCG
jgi:UDP-N-acetylglucosamine--N-acetylmuramyl-(pentapeptide) pyrophosphoryl-undecaprenol N-acetylglucosamine transferase